MSFEFGVALLEEADARAVMEGRREFGEVLDESPLAACGLNTSFTAAGVVIILLQGLTVDPGGDITSAGDLFAGPRSVGRDGDGEVHLFDPGQVGTLAAALAPLDPRSAPSLVDAAVRRSDLTPLESERQAEPIEYLAEDLVGLAEVVRAGARDGHWLLTTAG